MHLDRIKFAQVADQARDHRALRASHLHPEPAPGAEDPRQRAHKFADHGQSPILGHHGAVRLPVPYFGLGALPLRLRQVGRIGQYQIERPTPCRLEQRAVPEVDFGVPRGRGVLPGNFERIRGQLRGGDRPRASLVSKCDGDGPRPGADIERRIEDPVGPGNAGEHVDHVLGFGTRNRDAGIDAKVKVPEGSAFQEVLERLAGAAAPQQRPVVTQLGLRKRSVEVQVELKPVHAEDMGQQVLRVQARVFDTLLLQVRRAGADNLHDRPDARRGRLAGRLPGGATAGGCGGPAGRCGLPGFRAGLGGPSESRGPAGHERPTSPASRCSSLARRRAATSSARSPSRISPSL